MMTAKPTRLFISLFTVIIYTSSVISGCWAQPMPAADVSIEESSRPLLQVPANTVLPTELAGGTVVGTTVGAGGVSKDGAATYNIPLWVPPGRAGLEPSLSLDYSSLGGNGLLGVGWQMSGLPRIERCRRNIAQDGEAGPVEFALAPNSEDKQRFCLDGERLVPVNGTHGAAGTEYRTERDTFIKIIQFNDVNGVSHFKAYTKDGRILTFGNYTGRRSSYVLMIIPTGTGGASSLPGKLRTLVWALTRIQDRVGNTISEGVT